MDLFRYLMTNNGHNYLKDDDLFSYKLAKGGGGGGTYAIFTGTSISANNTRRGKMKLSLYGNTEQDSTTGINLLKLKNTTSGGLTTTLNSDGSISVSGTATETVAYLDTGESVSISAGALVLSIQSTLSVPLRMTLYNGSTNIGTMTISAGQTSTTNTPSQAITDYNVYLYNLVVGTSYNFTIYPMLESGSSATSWERYTGGIPAPNPDYPQDVHIVSGDNTINVTGKNLLNYADLSNQQYITIEGEYITITNDSGSAIYPTITYVTPLEATNYTSKIDVKSITAGKTLFIYLQENSSDYSAGHTITLNSVTEKVVTQTFSDTMKKYMLVVSAGTTVKLSAMLVKGTYTSETIGDYAPYTRTSYPIHLGEYELCKIGDYQDKFFKNIPNTTDYKSNLEDNEWYLEKKIQKITYTGQESEYWDNLSGTNKFYINLNRSLTYALMYSNYYTYYGVGQSNLSNGEFTNVGGIGTSLWFRNDDCANVSSFRTWLSTHNTNVYLPYETPTYTQITDTTLITQLENVWRANSYKGQTNISQVNDDLPSNLEVTVRVNE